MIDSNDKWDLLSGPLTELTSSDLEHQKNKQYLSDKDVAEQKINGVHNYLTANNNINDVRHIVDRFGLAWDLAKDYGNGIGLIIFYTDESQRFEALRLRLSINDWFRG